MVYSFRCPICCEEFSIVQPMDAPHKSFHCGVEAKRIWGENNTDKDLAYSFTTDMFDGKPVSITSKRQFKTLLKQHRIADASPKECFQEARFRKKINEESRIVNRRKAAVDIYRKMKGRGQLNYGRK